MSFSASSAPLLVMLLAALPGCNPERRAAGPEPKKTPAQPESKAASPEPKAASPEPKAARAPMTRAELPTTDGGIAVGNLLASLESGERLLRAQQKDEPRLMSNMVELRCATGQYLGRLADYDRAEVLAERLVRIAPKEPASYLARARVRSVFHRFSEALADMERAQALLGAEKDGRITSLRIAILQGQGKLTEALALAVAQREARRELGTLGVEALLRGALGQVREADALFTEGQGRFRDVSPFPVAWLYLQQGLMWEGEGMSGRARELYAAAHERLPAYATAASHLAAMEAATGGPDGRERAVALLRPIVQASDDPEYMGQLASLLPPGAEADRLVAQARARYEVLLKRHPEAFASHAARFYLKSGKDPARAARLARQNLGTAETPDAYALAIEAVQAGEGAAGEGAKAACDLAERALALPASTIGTRLRVACARALAACGQAERAAAELKKVTPP